MLPDTMFNDLMFPGNTCRSGRHAELWQLLISNRLCSRKCKKWIIGGLKASQLSVIEVLMLRDWEGLLSSLSGQIGWLTIQPFIHNPNEKATDETLSGERVYVCVIHGMRWRTDKDDNMTEMTSPFCLGFDVAWNQMMRLPLSPPHPIHFCLSCLSPYPR